MQHYAGRVTYDAASLLEKNRNFFPPEVIQLLRTSTDPIGIIMEPNMALIMQIFKLLQTLKKKKKLLFLFFVFLVRFLFQCPLTKTGNLFSKPPYGSPVMGRKLPVTISTELFAGEDLIKVKKS